MHSRLFTTSAGRVFPAALLLFAAFLAAPAESATPVAPKSQGNPFEQLKGDWTGGGIITTSKGDPKKVTCKVAYAPAGATTTQSMVCNGDDYQFDARTKFKYNGGKISGSWHETVYDASGNVSGTAAGDTVHARISGDKFSGRMSIVVSDDSHTINIVQLDSKTGTYRHAASVALKR